MTYLIPLLAVLVPSLVSALTGWLKSLPTFAEMSSSDRPFYVRLLAAGLAFVLVILTQWTTGTFDANIIATALQTVALTAGAWVASLGIFHGIFQKK